MDPRDARLNEPHIRPLMELVKDLRTRGHQAPNLDPNDGGVNARVLFLLETPGPRTVGSGFVSRDNPDPTAQNMGLALDDAGFVRADVVLWNVVPYCVSTLDRNRNATAAQIREAKVDTQAFIDKLSRLAVVVFCGRRAQRAIRHLSLPIGIEEFRTFHTGGRAYNHPRYREHIHTTFKKVHSLISN